MVKQGDVSIMMILSVIISIVGISLLFMLFAKTDMGKKFYCETVLKADVKLWQHRIDTYCEGESNLDILPFVGEESTITQFTSGEEILLNFSPPVYSVSATLQFEPIQEIISAEFLLVPLTSVNGLSLDIGGKGSSDWNRNTLDPSQPPYRIDITQPLANYAKAECNKACHIVLVFSASSQGEVVVKGLQVQYRAYKIKEAIYDEIFDCWNKAHYGEKKQSFLCNELVIPKNINMAVTERDITMLLKKKQYCHLLANNKDDLSGNLYDCGDENNIVFLVDLFNTTNILIEYRADTRQVVVS